MAYRNKTYVCFDADEDIHYYRLMTAWKENGNNAFDFHDAHDLNNLRDGSSEATIKRKLIVRLKNTKVLIVLIGEKTKNLHKYVRWEIEWAIENDIPIIAVNLDKTKKVSEHCPPILKDKLAIHIPFKQKIIDYALNNWPSSHKIHIKADDIEPYVYKDKVYESLGID